MYGRPPFRKGRSRRQRGLERSCIRPVDAVGCDRWPRWVSWIEFQAFRRAVSALTRRSVSIPVSDRLPCFLSAPCDLGAACRGSGCCRGGAITFCLGHEGPGDACALGRLGDDGDLDGPATEQTLQPRPGPVRPHAALAHEAGGAKHEQAPQAAIAGAGDRARAALVAARVLTRREPEPGRTKPNAPPKCTGQVTTARECTRF